MKTKSMKPLSLLLAVLLLCSLFAGCSEADSSVSPGPSETAGAASPQDSDDGPSAPSDSEPTKIAFISYMAIDSAEFLQNLAAALEQFADDHSDSVEVKIIEATQASEYEPKIRTACDAGYEIVITTYDSMAEATCAVSKDYPDVMFGILDGGIADIENYGNIEQFKLSRTETAFLAGIVAGSVTETGRVGIVAGSDSGSINEIVAGWQQGMRYVNPEIEDIVSYANTFTDPTKGKELGLALISQGCDIIGGAAGGTGVGVAQAAADSGTYYVAWDVHYEDVVADLELGSAVNYFDKMVLAFIDNAMNGGFAPGTTKIYGVAEGACAFDYLDNGLVSDEIKAAVSEAAEKIASGEIIVESEPLHK